MKEYTGNVPFDKKSLAIRLSITYGLAIAFLAVFYYTRGNPAGGMEEIEGPVSYIKYLPFALVPIAGIVSVYIAIRRFKNLKLVVQLREAAINGKVEGHYDITIQYNEIESIKQKDNGDIVIKGTQKLTGLMVPCAIDGFEEIQHHLSQWQPIEKESIVGKTKIDWKSSAFINSVGLLSSISFMFAQFSMNYYVIIIGATVCVIASAIAFFEYKKLEETMTFFKKAKWVLVFFSVIAIGKAVMVLVNPHILN